MKGLLDYEVLVATRHALHKLSASFIGLWGLGVS